VATALPVVQLFIEGVTVVNRNNYQQVKAYLEHLTSVMQLNPRSVSRYRFYLRHLLIWADEVSLSGAPNLRPTFSSYLAAVRQEEEAGPLAPTTLKKIIQTTKRFFTWLKTTYPSEFRGVSAAWIDTLRPPRSIQPAEDHEFISLEEIRRIAVLQIDPSDLALRRDQAAAVMLFLSGMRARAFSTLPICAVDLSSRTIKQWPSLGVETKNGKSATTYLLDISELLHVVEQWDTFVRSRLPKDAMWYAPVAHQWGEQSLSSELPGKNRSMALTKRIRTFLKVSGLPYKSPHKFRHGHAVYALQHARTMADYKAVSMNLMHEDIRVTDSIYAPLASHEVQQRIAGLTGSLISEPAVAGDMTAFIQTLSKDQLSKALMAIAQQMDNV
jgi:site-specific recombinase XerC